MLKKTHGLPMHITSCKQRCRDMSGLSQCLCSDNAKKDNAGSIQCKRVGCKTVWVSDCGDFASSRLNRASFIFDVLGIRMQVPKIGLARHAN